MYNDSLVFVDKPSENNRQKFETDETETNIFRWMYDVNEIHSFYIIENA